LDEALTQGYPAGLKHFGDWPTVYEGLSSLPEQVQKSWFGFDHFYSDSAFPDALKLIFGDKEGKKGQVCQQPVKSLLDVGGNTGKWAMKCVAYDPEVKVTIVDLPQQLEMMRRNVAGKEGAERISGIGMNLLDPNEAFQGGQHYDVIWMSQFLDCFSMEQIVSILKRVAQVMDKDSRVCIMETLWDRQKYETAAMCLTMTSVYFADIANGNSKMYNTEDMTACVEAAGLKVETIHDEVGQQGHCILVCKLSE
ncbi:MAG: methyltransferase domain-containing protein, partial [Bacteroidales bacterium]|nr:methyltransferase domain-containing protein [Bacteroidales bacterium]